MDDRVLETLRELERRGFKARAVSTGRLPQLQEDIDRFVREGLLDMKLRETYLRFMYAPPESLKGAATIFIVAIPQPITRATFAWQGKVYEADLPPTYIGADDARVKEALEAVLSPAGHRIARARLPVKTLAAHGGLAQYGRNNVAYVPGLGSFQRLVAFYTDCPGGEDDWQERAVMKACAECTICRENCPTHCIPDDRFLIHAENCLTWHNEREDALAEWIKPEWHNALIGCMRCQDVCPANKAQMRNVVAGPAFSEAETGLILDGTPWDALPEETRAKLRAIAHEELYPLLSRNLKALLLAKGVSRRKSR